MAANQPKVRRECPIKGGECYEWCRLDRSKPLKKGTKTRRDVLGELPNSIKERHVPSDEICEKAMW